MRASGLLFVRLIVVISLCLEREYNWLISYVTLLHSSVLIDLE